jgi:tetratricopeptide (TPR) repeat protein
VQHLDAVLAAWLGEPEWLGALLPERPRFHTDLTPVDADAGSPADTRALHEIVRLGRYGEALPGLEAAVTERPQDPTLWTSLAIAAERHGNLERAEEAWTHVIEIRDAPRARLARGVLRARRAALDGAAADFAHAGDSHEARWNRAALAVLRAVALTPGLPAHDTLEAARAEAEAPEGAWHEPTVGRLLWTLLVERAQMRAREGASPCPDERVLRAAELELEFDSFWDRGLLLHGYALLSMRGEAARIAMGVATDLARHLTGTRALHGAAGEPLLAVVKDVAARIDREAPAEARAALGPLLARTDLRMYRFPCAACDAGTIGVESFDDSISGA